MTTPVIWSKPMLPGARARMSWATAGRVLSVTDADGVVEVANAYDEQGRVLRQLSPFGRNTIFGYLPGRVTVTSDDTGGPANVFIHDAHGRLLSLQAGDETRMQLRLRRGRQPGRGQRPPAAPSPSRSGTSART